MHNPEALILDIDDTLVDTTASYRGAIIATAAHFGGTVTQADISAAKAAGDANNDWEVTWKLLRDRKVEVPLSEVTRCFETLYQGTSETPGLYLTETLLIDPADLQALAARYPLGIVTGRPRRDARVFLERFGFAHLFSAMMTMDDGPLKPSPIPVRQVMAALGHTRVWMIGDTPDDVRSARAAGAYAVGVIGPGDDPDLARSALKVAGAQMILEGVSKLRQTLGVE